MNQDPNQISLRAISSSLPSRCLFPRRLFCGLIATAVTLQLPAQTAPPPTATPPAEEAIELSPFEVRADKDIGYQAANTTSGSRLNTRLKDTTAKETGFSEGSDPGGVYERKCINS